MFFLIPFFMFTGIGIISIDSQRILGKIVNNPVPTVILTVVMSYVGQEYLDDEDYTWLIKFIATTPLYSLIFWSSLKYIGSFERDIMWYIASFFTICMFVPLYFLEPYMDHQWFGTGTEENWFGDSSDLAE